MRGSVTIKLKPGKRWRRRMERRMGLIEERLEKQDKVLDQIAASLQPLADDIRVLMDFKNDAMNTSAGNLSADQIEAFNKLDAKGNDILNRLRFLDGLNPNTPATPVPEPTPATDAPADAPVDSSAPAADTAPPAGNGTGDLSEQQKAEMNSGVTGVQPPGAQTDQPQS